MKVCYASQSFYPHIGGVSTYLLNVARELVNKGHKVKEMHLKTSEEGFEDNIYGIDISRVPKEGLDSETMKGFSQFKEAIYKECHNPNEIFTKNAPEMPGFKEYEKINKYFGEQLTELMEKDKPDIIHIHDFQLLCLHKYIPRHIPAVLTWHIPFNSEVSGHLAKFLAENMKAFDKIIFSTQEYIEEAVKIGIPREKTELIYPVAKTNLFKYLDIDKTEVRRKYGIPEDSKIILCVQRVDAKSGHEQLIKSMPEVLNSVPKAKLVFVGEKSMSSKFSKEREQMTNKVKQLVKDLGIEENVLFLPNIDYHELPKVYNSVDLVALCSRNEGFGLSLTEGMACGNPVIGTKVGGIPEQIEDGKNGYLVEVDDIDSTSKQISKTLNDKELQKQMSQRSLDIVEEKFKTEKGVEKHLKLYNSF